jgi:Putative Ig domain
MKTRKILNSCALTLAVLLASAHLAVAAPYPLEITAPRQSLPAGHRMLRAYPGLAYNIRAAVVGGMLPFTYSLTSAPAGMSINAQTGEITWVNPSTTATATVRVRDAEGTQVSQSWTIEVSTTGFKFVDAANGSSSGNGTIGSPFRTLADVHTRSAGNDIVYFRSGTYNTNGIPTVNSGLELRVEFDQQDGQPVKWLAYPGASPVLDYGYSGSATPRIRLAGETIYVEGFEVRNIYVMGFQVAHRGGQGGIFRRLNMHGLMVGGDGSNAAMIMTINVSQRAYGMVVQDSTFANVRGESAGLKFYATDRLLVENNVLRDLVSGSSEALAVKESNSHFTLRGNIFTNIAGNAIGGNMGDNSGSHSHTGEICFNNVRDAGSNGAVRVNMNGESGQVFIYRNTFQGRVLVHNVDSVDGPFTFTANVIVNDDSGTPSGSHITHDRVSAPSRVVLSNNLGGYPSQNIVDASGNLIGDFTRYLGTLGHVTGSVSTIPTPAAPTSVRVVR